MAEILVYGLKALKIGEPMADGSMQTTLKEPCRTYRDSCEFIEDDPETTEEFSDQSDDPVISMATKGKKSVKFSTFDYSPEVLQEFKGGTIVDGKWAEPETMPDIYKAVELETDTGAIIQFPKAKILAKFNGKLQKKNLSLLEITLTPLSPAKGKPAILIGKKS